MAWKLVYNFRVIGTPRPGGSKQMGYNPKTGKRHIYESCKKNPEWRASVVAAAILLTEPGTPLLDGCLMLEVTFWTKRPNGHFGAGKNAGKLRPSAPEFCNVMPDATKLLRSTEDALTKILWTDDARITDQAARKRYCPAGVPPGASINISVWEPELVRVDVMNEPTLFSILEGSDDGAG